MQPPSNYAPSQNEGSVARPASIEARNRKELAESDEEANMELLNQIRVVVRVRPLLQGEGVPYKRPITNTSGQMDFDCRRDIVNLRYDFKNKDMKTFKFDKVCDGSFGQKEFYNAIGVRGMVSQVVNGYHATIFAYG